MENPSGLRFGKLSTSVLPKGRTPKHGHPQEHVRNASAPETNSNHMCDEPAEGKRKGRPKAEVQELRSIPAHLIEQWREEFKCRSRVKCPCSGCWLEFPSIYGVKYHYQRCQVASVAEKLSHGCPYCEAVFATKVRLQKHKLWNHPDRVTGESKDEETKFHKSPVKTDIKKRSMENSPPSPTFCKMKRIHEASVPSQNGELSHQRSEAKLSQQMEQSQQSTSSDAGGSESEGGSLPQTFSDEDPERMKHRRKQKTPKKFTGEQPSISGTFGLKGMTKVDEKLKAGRLKRPEANTCNEEPQRRPAPSQSSKKDTAATSVGVVPDVQWQRAISDRGEVVCPTCSIVTRKTIQGLKKHMEICQKLQDALKCQQCQKQFRSKAGLNYHTMAEHSTKSSRSDGRSGDEREERQRLQRVLKQIGRIKCPSEGCSAHFSSLMGYQYHQKHCGRQLSDNEKSVFPCQHCGKTYRSAAGKDYHVRTEHSPIITAVTATTNNNNTRNNVPESNNTDKEWVASEECSTGSVKEQEQPESMDCREKSPLGQPKEKQGDARQKDGEKEKKTEQISKKTVQQQQQSQGEDFERTPSGRVRRRSAQVAVFHLQEIAEDELAKDWGTKRRIKDDLVPDSKRLNYTRPGLPNFSPEILEAWKNQVKEKGFICCTNEKCEAVYSSVSGLKAHFANCSQGGGEMGKYTCLICQKEFSSESGVKYHISKTHSQNWFRAAHTEVVSSSNSKAPENNGIKEEVRNCTTHGKKRGRKPKERPPADAPFPTDTEAPSFPQNPSHVMNASSSSTQSASLISEPTDGTDSGLNSRSAPLTPRQSKHKGLSSSK